MENQRYHGTMDETFIVPNEKELSVTWVELERSIFDESKNKMQRQTLIQCFTVNEFKRLEALKTDKRNPVNWVRASGWHNYTVLHDGSLNTDPETLKIK